MEHNTVFYCVVLMCVLIKKCSGISCWVCNSEYDPRCGLNFDSYSLGYVNCSLWDKPENVVEEATFCRKTITEAADKIRVVRTCGYVKDKYLDNPECVRRVTVGGTKHIYCSCSLNMCNKAPASVRHTYEYFIIFCLVLSKLF